jgi:CDP-diacylglycerol--serine O-phosphatidyltransferase
LIRHFLNPPNWFTSASIFCSIYAIALVAGASEITPKLLTQACIVIIFGTVFDALDGRVARLTRRFTEFGVQLDSLADLISFGVAPAILAYVWVLKPLGTLGIIVAFWYVLCASFRLARFNVDTQTGSWPLAGHTQGLTSTMSGFALVSIVWVCNGYLAPHLHVTAASGAALVVALGLLMVSSIPFRNFKDFRQNKRARRIFALGLALTLTAAFVFDPSMWFGAVAFLYLTWGLLDGVVAAVHYRHTLRLAADHEAEDALDET